MTHHISAVPVRNADGGLVGIVREEDLMHRVETGTERHHPWWLTVLAHAGELAHDHVKSHGMRAVDVMTRDIVSVRPGTPVDEVVDLLEKRHLRSVPVLSEGKVAGMVSRTDLVRGLATRHAPAQASLSADDETICRQLWQTLRSADWLNAACVHVSVKDGAVTLWGMVDSDEEKLALGIATSSISGVRAVEDHTAQIPAGAWAE